MRKLKLQIQMTIDGFVAGPNGENDWVFSSGTPGPEALQEMIGFGVERAAGCDTILLGRKLAASGFCTYWEGVADNQPDNPWRPLAKLIADHRKIVFSRSETTLPGRNLEVENGDLATVVQSLKTNPARISWFMAAPGLLARSSALTLLMNIILSLTPLL